eukprot:Amastigsp_a508808_253.p3 type:complete len:166 gc:universal Amastigsp_a508808_253:777-280(-)
MAVRSCASRSESTTPWMMRRRRRATIKPRNSPRLRAKISMNNAVMTIAASKRCKKLQRNSNPAATSEARSSARKTESRHSERMWSPSSISSSLWSLEMRIIAGISSGCSSSGSEQLNIAGRHTPSSFSTLPKEPWPMAISNEIATTSTKMSVMMNARKYLFSKKR